MSLTNDATQKTETDIITVVVELRNIYKTFSVLIYSYINTSGNWKNEKLCGYEKFPCLQVAGNFPCLH